jgi:hypothetical protein
MQRGEVKTLATSLNSARERAAESPIEVNADGGLSSTGFGVCATPSDTAVTANPSEIRPARAHMTSSSRNEFTTQRAQNSFRDCSVGEYRLSRRVGGDHSQIYGTKTGRCALGVMAMTRISPRAGSHRARRPGGCRGGAVGSSPGFARPAWQASCCKGSTIRRTPTIS